MLKQLHIHNIILIESETVTFDSTLNVLTGETGSGKSAIMGALALVIGARADTGMIRRGEKKAFVEALFDVDNIDDIGPLLAEAGIHHEPGDDLIIRREISNSGKGQAYINNQMAQVALLKRLGELLLTVVGQHANQRLLSVEEHRNIVDIYGELEGEVNAFSFCWQQENATEKALEELISAEAKRLREIEVCRTECEEIEGANLKEGEEEELFQEYGILTHSEELYQKASHILSVLSENEKSALPRLNQQNGLFADLVAIDATLKETAEAYTNALLELREVSYTLNNYLGGAEHNPQRMQEVNERLTLINRLKRKYGKTVAEVLEYQRQCSGKLEELENADQQIEVLEQRLSALRCQSDALASVLTEKRTLAANDLQEKVVKELRDLNMPKVEFHIEVSQQKRTNSGNNRIEFFLTPNVGEHRIPIRDCASGGELSRMMLALQTLLAGKEKIATLVFDEVDSNIGGETAVVVGVKLNHIAREHQVLCITHFPQVARQAAHHVQIAKVERDGRTFTTVQNLQGSDRNQELARMVGE